MLLIILYLLGLCIYFYLYAPLKTIKNDKIKNKKLEKFSSEKEPKLHYVKGFNIPQTAYKANTSGQDSFGFDINGRIKNSKAKNVHQLFNEITDDNYYLFNNMNNLKEDEASKDPLYVNLHYNPKTEKKYIFKTGLPKLDYEDRKIEMPQDIKIDYSSYKNKTTY